MVLFKKKDLNKIDQYTQKNGVRLVNLVDSKSIVAEQIRMIKTNIEFAGVAKNKLKSIVITSPEISDGKSTVSANLAIAWAQSGKRVLFMDADLRRPTLHSTFNLPNNEGLTSILSGQGSVETAIRHTVVGNLDVLVSGIVPPNPAELLGSKQMENLIKWAEEKYDLLIIDTAPVNLVTDGQILATKVDGTVLVVRYGKTQKTTTKRAIELIQHVEGNILGVVARGTQKEVAGYGYGYGYGYGNENSK
ncbi:CpsD/CapB family tyrosine-protein kinase [Periweissella ghanensis]|uniref:Tyrosine-protein kinase CpsD n=1 Tax=Periweissella ghanensis TaxID=467997 RepID=A0ABM8ZCX0_9LACO|nr:CpsD/CapB family tyrosine-protein kinase [Periweissella ghanensis]MCM0600245.1 CpsD/CapB family tyrosine-protein kinase [Periweissella ghanensis]CAH0419123.1 Tyrosine-protein kinase YwqD [Periweissella ghanensis]